MFAIIANPMPITPQQDMRDWANEIEGIEPLYIDWEGSVGDQLKSFIRVLLTSEIDRARAEERLQNMEFIGQIILESKDLDEINTLEYAQKIIFNKNL